jgi:hypothetical protein
VFMRLLLFCAYVLLVADQTAAAKCETASKGRSLVSQLKVQMVLTMRNNALSHEIVEDSFFAVLALWSVCLGTIVCW